MKLLQNKKKLFFLLLFLAICTPLLLSSYLRIPAPTPELSGQKLANQLGCFACHGSGGLEGASNPGATDDVPAWSGGNAMMYLKSDDDISSYIKHGHLDKHSHEEGGEHQKGLLEMPGYDDVLSQGQLEDLVAYVKAVSRFYPNMPKEASKGMRVDSKKGCFGCHGPSGRGGLSNPSSFKGIIPGWNGEDFAETVKNEEELKSWILEGYIPRFKESVAASFFIDRAKIKMPSFKNNMTDEELKDLMAYIKWVSEN